jgi:hypothetical protein
MKRFLPALLVFALVGCNLPDPQEAARLKTENETLLAQVQTLTSERDATVRERDDLRSRLQAIKDALENLPTTNSSSAPVAPNVPDPSAAPATPDSSAAPATPDPSAVPAVPDSSAVPTAPDTSAAPATPDPSAAPVAPETTPALPPVTASPDAPALEQLKKYADDVLTAAQNFKAQTRQEAPSNCLNGYAAGAYNVQKSLELKECSVVSEQNGDYRITARDAAGNSVSLP